MTSSFVDPTTVRSGFCRHCSSTSNQQTSLADESLCCGNHDNHQTHLHYNNANAQYIWPDQGAQVKRECLFRATAKLHTNLTPAPGLDWSNGFWYGQASPGAHVDDRDAAPAWEIPAPQTYTSHPASNSNTIQTSQPDTNHWLLQHSYHGFPDISGHTAPWSYMQVHSEYNDLQQNGYYSSSHDRPSYNSSANIPYSEASGGRSENMSTCVEQYAFPRSEGGQMHEGHHPEDAGVWNWSNSRSNSGLVHTLSHDMIHTPEPTPSSFFPESSPSAAKQTTQISPSSPTLDVDEDIHANTTNTMTLSDLIPSPPTELVDPPPEDMHPTDKSMIPQKRNLKDPKHLYMPRWIRGDGKEREGWCGACRPGKWLSLKRSTYWCRY